LEIDGHTLDITILFAGFISLRIGIMCSLIEIDWCVFIRLSSVILFDRNIQKRLFEILEPKSMFLGDTILLMAIMYSFCGMPSIELSTNVCSVDGGFSFAVIAAKVKTFLAFFSVVYCVWFILAVLSDSSVVVALSNFVVLCDVL